MKDKIRTRSRKSEGKEDNANMQDSRIKPKAGRRDFEVEDLNSFEGHEPVTEKLSIPIPVQPLQRPTGVMAYAGQRVRLLLRDGTVVIGFLQKRIWNYAHLLNVEETGKDFKITADWCDVDLGSIARIYPATAQVGPISRPQN